MDHAELQEKIKQLASLYLPEFTAIRRQLHAHPELGFQELETADYIASKLEEYGIPFKSEVAGTGIVGRIVGKNPSHKTIALRADMDALPVTEANDVEYKSKYPGVMHACGHDVHMACLLGAAKILNELKDEFNGTIKLIFQPSEEMFPGGAIKMIEEGVLENPKVENVFGQHVLPVLATGKVGMKAGKYMASTDEIYITVIGKGGHAATPELYINPLIIAAKILLRLQEEFDRHKPAGSLSVLAFGKIFGDGRTNIIPDEVKMDGTIRTFDEAWREKAHELISSVASSVANEMGGTCITDIDKGYPSLVNDDALTSSVRQSAIAYMGAENVVDLEMRMTAEDFAYFSQKLPSCFYRLGVRNEDKGIVSNLHTSTFDVDENCIAVGMGLMAWIACSSLDNVV